MGPYNLAAMRTFPRVFLLALCFGVLLGCQGHPPAAVWLADTPSAPWLVASTASDVGEEFRLHRLPCVPAAADGAPAFSGQVIATVARGKGVRLYFHDGAVCDFAPDAPGTLRSVAAPDAAGALYGMEATVVMQEVLVARAETVKVTKRRQTVMETQGGVLSVQPVTDDNTRLLADAL